MPNDRPKSWKPRTIAAQALGAVDAATKAVVPPVHVATTFVRDPDNQYRSGYAYGRPDNATVRQTEAVIAALEGAHEATLFGSGMAAATAVVLALPAPAHIVAPQVMYWAFRNWLVAEAPRFGHRVDLVDTTDLDAVRAAVRKPGKTALVWIETPANPLWTITDIAAVAEIAHAAGALLAVDSTVATPVFTRPLALGADIVMHSATKYLNGHSDVIAGALATARPGETWERIKTVRTQHGAILGPFEAWLLLRGLRTLDVRVKTQTESAVRLALGFANHPRRCERALSRPARPSRPCRRRAPDERLRRHAVDPRQGRRAGRHRHRRKGRAVEAGDLARRGREPDRAPRLGRGSGFALPARPAAALGRPRRPRRPL